MITTRFYKIIIGFLVLVNIGFISFTFINKPKRNKIEHGGFLEEVPKILDLNENQKHEFIDMAHNHHSEMIRIENEQKKILKKYFEQTDHLKKDNDLKELQVLEKEKIEVTENHFNEVKSLLLKEQLTHFKEFKNKALHILLYNSEKKHK